MIVSKIGSSPFPGADFHVLNFRGVYILKPLPSLNKSPLDFGFIYA